MSSAQDRPGFVLPGVSRVSEVGTEGRIFTSQWHAWRTAAKDVVPAGRIGKQQYAVDANGKPFNVSCDGIQRGHTRAQERGPLGFLFGSGQAAGRQRFPETLLSLCDDDPVLARTFRDVESFIGPAE